MGLKVTSSFPERFKELIGDTPYRDVGEKLSISASMVSYYLSGKRSPKVQTVAFIANYYGVDPVWLMGYDVPKHKEETPDVSVEGLNEDRAQLIQIINRMSDNQVRALRAIADQVLSLRDE